MKMKKENKQFFDKLVGNLLYLLIIGLFMFQISAGLAIAHIDAIYECQACSCVLKQKDAK
jgi:hypothetical protein